MIQPIFNMLVGLPGSGKSTFAKNCVSINRIVISSDDIREELWGDASDQQNPEQVFEEMFVRTMNALRSGKDVIYDATNLSARNRKYTLDRLRQTVDKNLIAICTVITCSISECKRRQNDRTRAVPDEVIDRMVRKFEAPWYNEGWDCIQVFTCGKMQDVDREHERMLGESHDNHHHSATLGMHCTECEARIREMLQQRPGAFNERESAMLIEAAYQHDLGKHKTKVYHDMKGNPTDEAHYYSHNNVGAYLWLSGSKKDNWSRDEFLFIAQLIQWHMQPFFLRDENGDYHHKFQKWCEKRNYKEMFYESICLLHEADKAAH